MFSLLAANVIRLKWSYLKIISKWTNPSFHPDSDTVLENYYIRTGSLHGLFIIEQVGFYF